MIRIRHISERYSEYLNSDHWQRLRAQALIRDGNKCVRCSRATDLSVHHKFYRPSLYDTILSDLATLCDVCHGKAHGKCIYYHLPDKQQRVEHEWFVVGKQERQGRKLIYQCRLCEVRVTIKVGKAPQEGFCKLPKRKKVKQKDAQKYWPEPVSIT